MSASPELHAPPGAVELREDVPLKGGGARLCGGGAGGPRAVLAAFGALSLAVTVALLTQIHYGDYQVVPHGSVSTSAAPCSAAGADALRRGGRAVDAAVAAALCLAVLAPHRTSLDASGAMIYWEYRSSRSQLPVQAEWGGPEEAAGAAGTGGARPPRLVAALAALHARYGALPWGDALRPAAELARAGYAVSARLAAAAAARGLPGYLPAAPRAEPALADYLDSLRHNTSSELCAAWRCSRAVRWAERAAARAGGWRVWGAGAGGAAGAAALQAALGANLTGVDAVLQSVVSSLQRQAAGAARWPGGVAAGLAVVDPRDTYVALVSGLSTAFGSAASEGGAWARDEPGAPLQLAPAVLAEERVCGARYVLGAESAAALAQGAAALLRAGGGAAAAERARLLVGAGGRALPEPTAPDAPQPAALNWVRQSGDALLSHADSRGGGVASRF